jgi:hypothetical protein
MPYRSPLGRFLVRWWPLPFALGMAVYGVLVPEPYALGTSIGETFGYAVAAMLLIASCFTPTRTLRMWALWWSTTIAVSRAITLVTHAPVIDAQRTAAGITVWLMFAYLLTMLTLISELAAGPREFRRWGH